MSVIVPSTIFVDFSGGRSGSMTSTWGQYFIWAEMQESAPEHERFNIPISHSCKQAFKVSDLVMAIHRALATHESLRTRLRRSADGGLDQVLYGDLRMPIDILEASDRDAEIAGRKEIRQRLLYKPFDFENEWPIRVGAITRDGLISHVLVVVSHHAIDGYAIRFLERTLWHHASTPSASMNLQPFEEAQYQASPAGQATSAAAEDYWRKTLLQTPPKMFRSRPAQGKTPRHCITNLISPAFPLAAQILSRDLKVGPSAVLLAALSVNITKVTESDRCVLRVEVNNRLRRELRQAVSSVEMEGIFIIETGHITFSEVIRQAWITAQDSYRYGYYDKRCIDAVRAEVERERGCRIDLSCWINDMRSAAAYPPPEELNISSIITRLDMTEVQWSRRHEQYKDTAVGLRVYGSPEAVKLELIADTHVLTPDQIEQMLRGIEAVVVEEVAGPGLTGPGILSRDGLPLRTHMPPGSGTV